MDKKTSVAYLPEYKVSIPAEENETADMLNYKYNVTLGGKKRSNFIGMQEYQEPTLEEVKSVVFNTEPKQKEESPETEYKKKTLDELGIEKLAKQPIQYKEEGDTDYVAPFFKSAVGGTIDFFGNIISGAYLAGQDLGAGFAGLDVGEKINIDPEIAESARRLKQSQANVRKVLGLEIDEDDSQLASDIGGLVSSLFNSFAVAALTKSTYAVASLFGLSSGGETYLNLREQGIGALEALRTSSSVGFTEGALEKFGLDRLFESYVFKLGKNIGLKTVGKQTLVDVIQESSQSLSRNFLMAPYEEGYQFNRWMKEALYEGMLGGLISPVSGGAVYLTTKQLREKHSKVFQDKMGLSKEQADQLAVQTVLAPEDAKANILEIMNNEVLANEENQTLVEDAEQTVQQGKDLLDKLLSQKALGLSDESQAIVDENAQKIKERAIAEGLSEEEAEDAAKLGSNLLKNTLSLATELGVTEEQLAEDFNFDITNAEDTLEKVAYVDENGGYVGEEEISIEDERNAIQEAYREEEVASLMASGMSEDEARFRVETGREPTDFDRAIGFNYIPYQTGNSIDYNNISQSNEYKEIKSKANEVANSLGLEVKTVSINREGGISAYISTPYGDIRISDHPTSHFYGVLNVNALTPVEGIIEEYNAVSERLQNEEERRKTFNSVVESIKQQYTLQEIKQIAGNSVLSTIILKPHSGYLNNEFHGKDAEIKEKWKNNDLSILTPFNDSDEQSKGGEARYQFGGPSARTAALDKLDIAKKALENGYPKEEIRQLTGWFQGADGKWRFEISDKDATVNANIFNNRSYVLEDVLAHDKLYEAYPELARVETSVDEDLKDTPTMAALVYSYEDRYNNPTSLPFKLKINPDALSKSSDELKSILLHEVQHMIQRLEGFATGGSPKFFRENKEAFKQAFKDMASKKYKKALYDELYSKVDETLGDEILKADEESLKASKQWMKFVFDNNGDETSSEALKLEEEYDNARENLVRALEKAGLTKDDYAEIKKKARDTAGMDAFQRVRDVEHYDEYDLYKRLYGEIEARNTQTRMNMSEEERLATSPESTQDYSSDEAIVVFDDGTVVAYEPEKVETVKITGKEVGEYTGDRKAYFKAFAKYYKKHLAGKTVTSPVLGKVKFFASSINETEHHNQYTPENLKYIVAVPQIIKTSRDVTREDIKHYKKDVIAAWRIRGDVDINGDIRNVSVVVLEDKQHNRYYTLDARKKITSADTAVNGRAEEVKSDNIAYEDNITPSGRDVNSPRYQTEAEEKNLVAVHSISASSLDKAIDFGGFPVPSIAIVNKNQEFHFDDQPITLVGNKEMIDPSNELNEVYNRDIWSKTFPSKTYKTPSYAKTKKFREKFADFFKRSVSENSLGSFLYVAERGNPLSAMNEFSRSSGAILYYLEKVKGEKVELPKRDMSSDYLSDMDEQLASEIKGLDSSEDRESISNAVKRMIDREVDRKIKKLDQSSKMHKKIAEVYKEKMLERYFDKNGNIYFGVADRFVNNANRFYQSKGKEVLDHYEVNRFLLDRVKDDSDYQKWAVKFFEEELVGEPMVEIGNKLKPFTLDNVVEAMISGATVATQESVFFGSGKIIASGAKKLETIRDIKEEGKKLVTKEQSRENMKEVNEQINTFTQNFMNTDDFSDNMSRRDASGEALAQIVKNKNITKDSLRKALNKHLAEKKNYPDDVLSYGVTLANNIKEMSRYYFEAKPQRAVGLQEFSAAIIPTDSSYDEIAQKVQDNGLKVIRSDNQVEAVNELNKEREVFFQIQEYEDLRSTKSVSDVKKLLRGLSPDEEVRLMFDKNKGYWFAIDAQNYVHQDMITKAFEQGLYPEFRNSYEAQQYFDENYNADDEYLVRFKAHNFIDENDLQKLLDENIPYDEYKYGYAVKNNDGSGYVLFARSLYDLADTPLKSIGRDAEIWERNPYNMTEFSKVSSQELERNGIRYMAEGGGRKPIKPYKRNPLKVLGQYEPTKKMITLFKGRNPTTLIHEMGHHYLPIQLRLLEKAGKWDKLKPLYKELGISSVEQMGRDAEEKLIDMFTSYIFYNEAPNVETQSIFERAKQWMISAYNTVKNFVKPSEEVAKFFDELIAGEENAPDISHLVGKEAELSKILQGARHGQELTINGLSMKDIAILRQALHARVPRRGRSLADVIRKAGGIDSRSEIAKALGYDSRKGGEMGFWNYRGTIDNEQALIELLVAEGFLFDVEQDSAEGVQAVWNKVEQLINNRDTTFSEAEQMQNEKREQAYKVQEMVNNILVKHYNKDIKTLEEDMKAVTKKLADIGAVAVDKATLEYLQNSLAKMSKDYRKLLSEKKEKQYKYQEELTKFIKSSPLNNKDKLKLIDKIRMVKDERTFEKYLGEAKSQIEKYVEAESKRVLDDLIQKEIKSSRPRKAMAQLYNYENNKLFADLREWNKLNQDNAEAMAIKLDEVIAQGGGELSRSDKLRRMFLEYKTFGKDCSVEFMQALHDEIKAAKQAGIDAKDDADFMRSFEREQDREAVLEKIKESKADKNKFVTKVVNAYRRGISNLYSMLNSLVGKEIAEKFQFETVLEDKNIKEWKHLKATNEKARKIYGVEKDSDLMNIMADKGKPMFVLYKKVSNDDPLSEELNKDYKYELSVLDLIDIYNAMKNKKTAEDYVKAYGIGQLEGLLSNLTDQDRAFADMLMEDVNSRYKAINKVYINLYGMDLKRVDNYWMSSTEHSSPFDLYNDIQMQATTPGFFKERTKGQIIPVPKNAWLKYQNHIAQGYYMTEVAEKFKELSEVFKSKRIENMIRNKFGDGVYNTLVEQINAIGLNAPTDNVDDVSKVFQSAVNNWVGAKIALNPVVFAGQLTSFTNYAVDVPVKAYLKNFAYALRHPKEAFDFMMKHNKDFLMHRYESGFNEAMSRFIKDATEASNKKFGLSPKAQFGWSNALSSLVRLGDIGSLIFGGYGQFKTLLDNGMSIEEAKEKFEFSTLRSQQSGNAASISGWQRKQGVSRLLLSFKNTPMQYTRKIMDTVISLQNGDISKVQATKTLTNYLLIQPAIWVFVRNVVKDLLGLDDEDDEYTDGILEQILVNPIEAIPVVSDFVKAGYKAATDQYVYGVFSMPLLDDVEKSVKKMQKQEKDAFDWADIFIPYVEALTSAPVGTAKRYAQKWIED